MGQGIQNILDYSVLRRDVQIVALERIDRIPYVARLANDKLILLYIVLDLVYERSARFGKI